ncbi:hypothetical protein FO519_000771 [Halicephalobus sp. NKZ332]|nr:hypothetical protein FO519_000771 [Halicephalobus sp. NKZ332]
MPPGSTTASNPVVPAAKPFFEAVIQRQDTKCRRPGSCEQEPSVRKMCRACRYRKCLEIGMSKEALQPRRDLIGCRRFANTRRSSVNSNGDFQPGTEEGPSLSSGESQNELLKLIQKLTTSDENIRLKKFEMIRTKMEAKKLSELSKNEAWVPEEFHVMLASDISAVTQVEMVTMMEWAQTLPKFMTLPLCDRITLLKRFAVHHLILEHGYYTASLNVRDVWFISNGSCMPRQVNILPEESKRCVAEDRKWRQEKLYTEMTNRCIDEVVYPLRRLRLSPEELCALKIIMLFNCGNHYHTEENLSFISEESRRTIIDIKNKVIAGLFQHYHHIRYDNYEERFGNVLLSISGIVSAASALLEITMTTWIYLAVGLICVFVTPGLGQQPDCAKPQNETCDISLLSCCDKNLRSYLNFTSAICEGSSTFADPLCYRRAIENLYANGGVNGLLNVCDAYNLFKDCLDISMVSCMTNSFYILNGYGSFIASRVEILYGQLQFSCGAGIQSFLSNEDCFPSTWKNNMPALEKCRVDLDNEYSQDRCLANSNFLGCVQVPFQQGCSKESAWWMCEYSRTAAHIFFPECRGSCLMNNQVAK